MSLKEDLNPDNWPIIDITSIKNEDNHVSVRTSVKDMSQFNNRFLRVDLLMLTSKPNEKWKCIITPTEEPEK